MRSDRLSHSFFINSDVASIAQNLLGCLLVTEFDGTKTSGIIVETEAYGGLDDRASHAYQNKKTRRNSVMFERGGVSYVYLCYGLHHLFNVVTGRMGDPKAVLIRALSPVDGIDLMRKRREGRTNLCSGPGVLTSALGISLEHNNMPLVGSSLYIEKSQKLAQDQIVAAPRIGVAYAGDDALRPWRFCVKDSPWVSVKP